MSQRITRRQLLGTGIKAGFGVALWKELRLGTKQASAFTSASAMLADDKRFRAALARLDEFIAAHLKDIGAPGMTLALATGEGLLRASSYGLADVSMVFQRAVHRAQVVRLPQRMGRVRRPLSQRQSVVRQYARLCKKGEIVG